MRALAFFLCLLAIALSGCTTVTVIAYNLPQREANEIVVLLTSHGIPAQKEAVAASTTGAQSATQLWNITVPAKMITDAIAILNQVGLPRTKGTSLLDLFGAQSLVPSEMQNRIRFQEGLSEQLATTLRKMDGIIDADVQITFPQDGESQIPLTASVYVQHRGVLDNPNSLMITKIKRLVSSAVPGLAIDNVSVITDRALFSDVTVESIDIAQEYDYVSIWGVIVAKQSVALFRFILYALLVLLFLLACALIWTGWKIYPMVSSWGFATLFHPAPYQAAPKEVVDEVLSREEEESPSTEVEESAYQVTSGKQKGTPER